MNSIGSTQGSLNDLNLEIRNAKKEHEKLLKAVENLSDRYLQITMRLERLNSELSINQRKQELAVGQELVSLRNRELQILKEKKALNQQNANELKEEQKELEKLQSQAGNTAANNGNYTVTGFDTSVIDNSTGSTLGKNIAKYGCQFIGNPYVYGGTSLTKANPHNRKKIGYAELFLSKGGIYLHMSKKSSIFARILL